MFDGFQGGALGLDQKPGDFAMTVVQCEEESFSESVASIHNKYPPRGGGHCKWRLSGPVPQQRACQCHSVADGSVWFGSGHFGPTREPNRPASVRTDPVPSSNRTKPAEPNPYKLE